MCSSSSPDRFRSKVHGSFCLTKLNRICALSIALVVTCLMITLIGCGSGTAPSSSETVSPQLTVSAASLSFGSVTVNTATTQSLTLTSAGTSPVVVNSAAITGAGFSILGGSFPATLNPGQTLMLQVQFSPTTTGSVSGQVTINSNSSTGSAMVVTLSGTSTVSASPQLSVSATSLSFGNVTVNSSTTQSLTLTSTGSSPVTVNSAAVAGTGFSLGGGSLPVTLNPGQALTLQVQFSPTVTGSVSGQVTINSNSSTGSTTMVTLSGTSTAAASPQLSVSAASLSFGNVAVNTVTTQSLTLTSTGTSPVTVNSVGITGAGFTIVASSFPVTLNPSQALTLQVQFDPTTAGIASGQITISSNSATGGTALVALGGTGTAANPQLTVSAMNLSFGSVTVNTATTQPLILTSTGTSPVTVNSAAITGAGFSILGGSFPVTLNPGQTLTIQVQFSPTATGTASGQITISSNSASGGTALVSLSGTSTAATPHEVDLSWDAPVGSVDPVAGYNVYRSTVSGPFVLINLSPDVAVVYVDNTVVSGASYSYYVKSVDSSGVESIASSQVTVTIP
jgi:Abnormal spindle-like microcephaly-assoc'd, ASPM-SPD-2-Hydin